MSTGVAGTDVSINDDRGPAKGGLHIIYILVFVLLFRSPFSIWRFFGIWKAKGQLSLSWLGLCRHKTSEIPAAKVELVLEKVC